VIYQDSEGLIELLDYIESLPGQGIVPHRLESQCCEKLQRTARKATKPRCRALGPTEHLSM
jgi:hypothetical protein